MTYKPLISGSNIKTINNVPVLGSGNLDTSATANNYTELLLSFNGTNNSTNFVDESKNNYLIVPTGTPIISTTESKFGGSSLYLDGSSYLSTTNTYFKSDWTIECWIKTNSTAIMTIISQEVGNFANSQSFLLNIASPTPSIDYYNSSIGGSAAMINNNTNVLDNQWHHLALVRNKFNAYLYSDGLLKATYSDWKALNISNNAPFVIGSHISYGRSYTGYMDSFRISSTAIYTPILYPNGFSLPDVNFNVTAL